jgi:hypothetical protein
VLTSPLTSVPPLQALDACAHALELGQCARALYSASGVRLDTIDDLRACDVRAVDLDSLQALRSPAPARAG